MAKARVLTQAFIETVKPAADKRMEYPDTKAPGLRFTVQPSNARSWEWRFRFAGRPAKLTLGSFPALGLAVARDLARKAAAELAGGVDPREKRRAAKAEARAARTQAREPLLVKTRVEMFVNQKKRQVRERSWRQVKYLLERGLVEPWGGRGISELRKPEVVAHLDQVAERAPVAANRMLQVMRQFFEWNLERGVIETNPCAGIRTPGGAERTRDRVLDDGELVSLWRAAEALGYPAGAAVQLLILTGSRLREITEMKWPEVDLAKAVWTLPALRAKNGREHTIPLSTSAKEILEACHHFRQCGAVFTYNGRVPLSSMTEAKQRLDQAMPTKKPFVLHDIRRTVATGFQRLGVRLEVTEAVLNHVSGSRAGIIGVYQKYEYVEEKRAALDAWTARVKQLVTGEAPASNVVELIRA